MIQLRAVAVVSLPAVLIHMLGIGTASPVEILANTKSDAWAANWMLVISCKFLVSKIRVRKSGLLLGVFSLLPSHLSSCTIKVQNNIGRSTFQSNLECEPHVLWCLASAFQWDGALQP